MFESVLEPHGNQSKIIRGLQSRLCGGVAGFAPFEPFFVRFDGAVPLEAATAARAERIVCVGGRVELCCSVEVGDKMFFGSLLVGFLFDAADSCKNIIEKMCFSELPFDFPVFRIARAAFEEDGFSVQWQVSGGAWKKIR
ncbi:MAG: hypothetical protein II921_02170 [Treponema sp.]|nr:hypothetical protein [Treponema sp.]